MKVNPLTLTPGELRAAQRTAKMTAGIVGVLEDPAHPEWVQALTGFAWLTLRRDTPTLPYAEVEALSLGDLMGRLGLEQEAGDGGE